MCNIVVYNLCRGIYPGEWRDSIPTLYGPYWGLRFRVKFDQAHLKIILEWKCGQLVYTVYGNVHIITLQHRQNDD